MRFFLALAVATVLVAPLSGRYSAAAVRHEVVLADGLRFVDVRIGQGSPAKRGDRVTVQYVGTLDNKKKFDSSRDSGKPFRFTLGRREVIAGWDEGVAGMRTGGLRRLTIPPALGYGSAGAGNVIPPNARLHFDVEVIAIDRDG